MNNMKNIYYISFLSRPTRGQETSEIPEDMAFFALRTR